MSPCEPDAENESMMNGWEIIDVNSPGTVLKWGYNNYYHYVTV